MSAIGRLRRRLVLEAPVTTTDGAGGFDVAWSAVANLWAEIVTLSGREGFRDEAVTAEATHRITVRRRDDLRTIMRFREASRLYDILAVIEDRERRRWTACLCRERPGL